MYSYQQGGAWNLQPRQTQPRLPPGWEAKWDPNSRRWFYINHHNKTTHWELPSMPATQAPAARNVTTSFIEVDPRKVQTIVSEYKGTTEEYARSLLRIYQNNMTAVRKTLNEKGYKKKGPAIQPNERIVDSLKTQYPTAGEDLIREVLVNSSNKFIDARTSLESMGYKKKKPVKKVNKEPENKSFAKMTAETSFVEKKEGNRAAKSPSSSELSEQTKKSRIQELKKKFPTISEDVIKISLEGTMYDVELASFILQPSTTKTTRSQERVTTTPKKLFADEPTETKPASYEPVIFGAEEEEKPQYPPLSSISTQASSSKIVPPQATYTRPEYSYKKRDYIVPGRKAYNRKYTKPTGNMSSNRCTPVGPDPSLANGPNTAILQTKLIKATGPNPNIRHGPQPSNRCGPIPSYAKGRAWLDVGPACAAV